MKVILLFVAALLLITGCSTDDETTDSHPFGFFATINSADNSDGTPFLSDSHVESLAVVTVGDSKALHVSLTAEGAAINTFTSANNINRQMIIGVNGIVIANPTIIVPSGPGQN